MLRRLTLKLMIGCLFLALCGCANTSKEQVGTVTGSIAGGIVGTAFGAGTGQIYAIGVGAFAGAVVGNMVGRTIDKYEVNHLKEQPETTKAMIHDPQKKITFQALLEKDWITNGANPYCHQYISIAENKGMKRHNHGIACLEKGVWVAVRKVNEL